ncbi:hypothetical protein CBP51_06175 [Cellvibrio mixtus]|uniref:Uncharacterized protein n=1 Tax=Cellvibrio mixtus TaxID=39650 RepID=A0A266Q9M4_9GAMM|nr:hypothetical protein CBP51_06175 [Cellvibrio mixtus]
MFLSCFNLRVILGRRAEQDEYVCKPCLLTLSLMKKPININMTLLDHYPAGGKSEETLRKEKRQTKRAVTQLNRQKTIATPALFTGKAGVRQQ